MTIYALLTDGIQLDLTNPNDMPDVTKIAKMEEPCVKAEIILPTEHIGRIMELCQERRGEYIGIEYIEETHMKITINIRHGHGG